jgi:hypothetical protein
MVAYIDTVEHMNLLGSIKLELPASVASRSGIRRAKQHLRAQLKMPQHGSEDMHMSKLKEWQVTFG